MVDCCLFFILFYPHNPAHIPIDCCVVCVVFLLAVAVAFGLKVTNPPAASSIHSLVTEAFVLVFGGLWAAVRRQLAMVRVEGGRGCNLSGKNGEKRAFLE